LRLERHDWDKAVMDLQAAIKLDANQYSAYESLAQAFLGQKKHDRAVEEITRAIALKPNLPLLYRGRAEFELRRKDPTPAHQARALADLEQAIRLDTPGNPDLARDHTVRAELLRQDSRNQEALAACESALKVVPDYARAHRLRLDLLRQLKRYDE